MKSLTNHAPPNWRDQAACAGLELDLFLLADDRRNRREQALAVCHACPVRLACLLDAAARRDYGVVRGGQALERPLPACHECGALLSPTRGRRRLYCEGSCQQTVRRRQILYSQRRRKSAVRASRTRCIKGIHDWTPDNIKVTAAGAELCLACHVTTVTKRAAERAAAHAPRTQTAAAS